MQKLCIVMFGLLILVHGQAEDDLVNTTMIEEFPEYEHDVYAGYLNITLYDKAFYYFLFKSQSGHDNDPVILWLNGGPGCSSMIGMTSENGPFIFQPNSTKMKLNEHSWNKNAHVIYLESPAGVGFSVGKPESLVYNDTEVAQDNLVALQRFFERFSELKPNDFYLAGESYAGIYIPRLADEIIRFNTEETSEERKINLQGIILGNPCTHPTQCYTETYVSRFQVEFMYTRYFLDNADYSMYQIDCENLESSKPCVEIQKKIYDDFYNSGANIYNIFGKCYHPTYPPKVDYYLEKLGGYLQENPKIKHPLHCSDAIGPLTLFNRDENRPYLHVGLTNDTLFWTPCSDELNYTMESKASYSYLFGLRKAGIKIWYYSGDVDAMVPIQGTLWWINKFRQDYGIAVKRTWRPWAPPEDKKLAGMVWELDGLTFVSVIGAGHMVPGDKPAAAQQMLNVFLGLASWDSPTSPLQMI